MWRIAAPASNHRTTAPVLLGRLPESLGIRAARLQQRLLKLEEGLATLRMPPHWGTQLRAKSVSRP
jgi:hypothetical protein